MLTAIFAVAGFAVTAASASPTPSSTTTSANLAGYASQDTNSTAFNDVRSNLQILPAFPGTAIGTVAHGVVLQEYATGLNDETAGFGVVNGATTSYTCDNGGNPATQWILKFGYTTEQAGNPVKPSDLTKYVFDGDQLTCVAPGTTNYYVEEHDSTKGNCLGLDAGFSEPGDVVTNGLIYGGNGPNCWSLGWEGPAVRFHEYGAGVAADTGADFAMIASGTVFSFNRDGITVLLQPNLKAGATNSRLTFDSFPIREYIATQNGVAVAPGNLLVGSPGPFGSGSKFQVTIATP